MKIKRVQCVVLLAMLLSGSIASAQVLVKGNVYGGGELGIVTVDTKVTINAGSTTEGSVYGGGKGVETSVEAGSVKGNTLVNMTGGQVDRSIYGGGELGSVGTFIELYPAGTTGRHVPNEPKTCQENTGIAKVLISGGQVGVDHAAMPTPNSDDDFGYVFCGGRGEVDTASYPLANLLAVVDSTRLEISGTALITASVYGGCENGLVLRNTSVKISGGQIGTGFNTVSNTWDGMYDDNAWANAIEAIKAGTFDASASSFHTCDAWDFTAPYEPYDVFADKTGYQQGGSTTATDGHTFYGNVFGGGSGYYPFWSDEDGSVWRRSAGRVEGNTTVEITDGHILSSVYGGNEITDVFGKSTVTILGGTIGVPRTMEQIVANPVNGHVFGAGKGDPRSYFNNWTNVNEAEVTVTGGVIFGCVYGGGEDGHVTGNTTVNVRQNPNTPTVTPWIGIWGNSCYDGIVFGAGRGLMGSNVEAGRVLGNTEVNIETGTVLGSVYGGGRMASVDGQGTVNISGGVIGNDLELPNEHTKGGNVFGGSMGALNKLGTTDQINALWPQLAQMQKAKVNLIGGLVKCNVYGGSEFGSVCDSAVVVVDEKANVTPPVVSGSVFGGGFGSDDYNVYTQFTDSTAYPGLYAGRVQGHTLVKVKSGTINKNIYGGGELASVGIVKNNTLLKGNTNVVVTGGTIGNATIYNDLWLYETDPIPDDVGHVYGGSKGVENDPDRHYKDYGNVNYARIDISGGKIYGSVYGGGADAHVLGNDTVRIHTGADIGTKGFSSWDGNVFGGGKGNIYNHTGGRVAGNTYVEMDGGTIKGSIFGGGRLGITGISGCDDSGIPTVFLDESGVYDYINHGYSTVVVRGNATYIGTNEIEDLLSSDYSVGDIFGGGRGDIFEYEDIWGGRVANAEINISDSPQIRGSVFGGGEMASIGYWYNQDDKSPFYPQSGSAIVNVGLMSTDSPTIGSAGEFLYVDPNDNPGDWTIYDDDDKIIHTCTGNVFGGSQGDVDPLSEHWVSMGRSNNATVNITGNSVILGSVFGGSEQGTTAGNTEVVVTGGTVGTIVNSGDNQYVVGDIYGAGYGSDNPTENNDTTPNDSTDYVSNATPLALAGRVYGNTRVDMLGGVVRGKVFGGSAFAYVGNTTVNVGNATQSNYTINDNIYGGNNRNGVVVGNTNVNINAGILGNDTGTQIDVFGGGLGDNTSTQGSVNVTLDKVGSVAPIVYGDIYGGSAYGSVSDDANDTIKVNIIDGVVKKTIYNSQTYGGDVYGGGLGVAKNNYDRGKVEGVIKVNIGQPQWYTISPTTNHDTTIYNVGFATIENNVYGCNNTGGSPRQDVYVNIYGTAQTDGVNTVDAAGFAIDNVFGGGNYADNVASGKTVHVNIFGCDNTIRRVFGGGDASASPNVSTMIEGGRFDYVFGGGNGELGAAYAANINGNVSLAIHGGTVGMSFAGSNEHGIISGTSTITIDDNGPCGSMNIDEFFCGGNFVDVYGDVDATITCSGAMAVRNIYGGCNLADVKKKADGTGGNINLTIQGGTYENVYGGSKGDLAALNNGTTITGHTDHLVTIEGNITLNIQGGTIDTVFGGCNINGDVKGKITVNVNDANSSACPLVLHNVYGGGRNAWYTPNEVNGKIIASPEVNIINGTISKIDDGTGGNVFGGGFGSASFGGGIGNGAVVTANPKVTIGGSTTNTDSATVEGNVYGAGHGAKVVGNPHVILDGSSAVDIKGNVFGAGSEAEVEGDPKVEIK